jgi:acyl-CoA oxidase
MADSSEFDRDLPAVGTSYRELVELFTGPCGYEPSATGLDAQLSSPYRRLWRLQTRLDDGRPLLADHTRLRFVLELSAMVDPRLFHVMFLHHCMTIGTVLDYGGYEADLAALISGKWIGAALMTEMGYGNSSSGIRTEAVYDPANRDFVLNTPVPAAAKFPANVGLAGIPRLGVVSARLLVGGVDCGTTLFLVALRDECGPCPGVTIEPRPQTALLPLDYATVRFSEVRVPYRRWLNDGAAIAADNTYHDPLSASAARSRRSLGHSRFACGAVTAGLAAVARSSVALAVTHARRRPILDRIGGRVTALDHLNQQGLLFGAAAAAMAATVLARRATDRCWHIPPGGGRGTGPTPAQLRELALIKVVVNVLAESAVTRCRSACGAHGFFSENRLIDYQGLATAAI